MTLTHEELEALRKDVERVEQMLVTQTNRAADQLQLAWLMREKVRRIQNVLRCHGVDPLRPPKASE